MKYVYFALHVTCNQSSTCVYTCAFVSWSRTHANLGVEPRQGGGVYSHSYGHHLVNEVWIPYGVKFSQFLELKNHPTETENQQTHTYKHTYKHTFTHMHNMHSVHVYTHRYVDTQICIVHIYCMYNIYTHMYTIHRQASNGQLCNTRRWWSWVKCIQFYVTVGPAWTHSEEEELDQAGYTTPQQRLLTVLPLGGVPSVLDHHNSQCQHSSDLHYSWSQAGFDKCINIANEVHTYYDSHWLAAHYICIYI